MIKNILLLGTFLFLGYVLNAQNFDNTEFNSIKHNRIYHIDIGDYQTIEFVESKNNKVTASIVNRAWVTNNSKKKFTKYGQRIEIPNDSAKIIMKQLVASDFEALPDCKNVDNCAKVKEGVPYMFTSTTGDGTNQRTYYNLKSADYYTKNRIIIPTEVINARMLLSKVSLNYNLDYIYKRFLKALPKGKYVYQDTIYKND